MVFVFSFFVHYLPQESVCFLAKKNLDHDVHLDNDDHLLTLFDSTFMDGGSHIVPVAHIMMLDLLKSRRFPVAYRKTTI